MDFDSAIPRFESWRPSHPVRQKFEIQRRPQKSPPFVDYLTTANSLHVPKSAKSPANSPEVSTETLNYSRFLESPIGNYFRSSNACPSSQCWMRGDACVRGQKRYWGSTKPRVSGSESSLVFRNRTGIVGGCNRPYCRMVVLCFCFSAYMRASARFMRTLGIVVGLQLGKPYRRSLPRAMPSRTRPEVSPRFGPRW